MRGKTNHSNDGDGHVSGLDVFGFTDSGAGEGVKQGVSKVSENKV